MTLLEWAKEHPDDTLAKMDEPIVPFAMYTFDFDTDYKFLPISMYAPLSAYMLIVSHHHGTFRPVQRTDITLNTVYIVGDTGDLWQGKDFNNKTVREILAQCYGITK